SGIARRKRIHGDRAVAGFAGFSTEMNAMLSRRKFLSVAAAGAGAMLVSPQIAFASVATESRFVFVIQRGAADGLNIVVPYAEPAYATLRGALAIDASKA